MSVDKIGIREFAEKLLKDHDGGEHDPIPCVGLSAVHVIELLDEIESLRKDADRYRFIRMFGGKSWSKQDGNERMVGEKYDWCVDLDMDRYK
ncbi:hypothetical protein D3C77_332660 [compost metagenome]